MNRFPLFIDLTGKRAVVIGGGTVGLRRAEVLAYFGARVTVISPALAHPVENLSHLSRPYQAGDLRDAFLVVAAADDSAVNTAVWAVSSTAPTTPAAATSSFPPCVWETDWWPV